MNAQSSGVVREVKLQSEDAVNVFALPADERAERTPVPGDGHFAVGHATLVRHQHLNAIGPDDGKGSFKPVIFDRSRLAVAVIIATVPRAMHASVLVVQGGEPRVDEIEGPRSVKDALDIACRDDVAIGQASPSNGPPSGHPRSVPRHGWPCRPPGRHLLAPSRADRRPSRSWAVHGHRTTRVRRRGIPPGRQPR